ncbi:Putative cytosolic protein (plasmid) [Borrelia crocidurae DOU]|uniref:Putative cytosolic protein n=1 Tax=Borrelia crocidurae DOU TaxID=1293575 RepID=W5SR75_9SPIR|nr:Putative cytosolic protein [Borrelia crocidurae DOU]
MTNSYKLEVHKSHKHRFPISFKKLLTQEKVKWLGLFAIKDNNKFLDISYSYKKSIKNKNVVKNYKKK